MSTLYENVGIFMIVSRWILLRIKNVSENTCRENQGTPFMLNNFFHKKYCRLRDKAEKYEVYVHKSLHRKSMLIIGQRDVTIYNLFIDANFSTCFGWWHHHQEHI